MDEPMVQDLDLIVGHRERLAYLKLVFDDMNIRWTLNDAKLRYMAITWRVRDLYFKKFLGWTRLHVLIVHLDNSHSRRN